MSPVKEPRYFSTIPGIKGRPQPIRDKKEYLKLFAGVRNEIAIGEASTSYLADSDSANLIHQEVPKADIIIILRDPVERAYSSYLNRKRLGRTKLSFHNYLAEFVKKEKIGLKNEIQLLTPGLYSESVKRYLDVFGKDKVTIIIFEEFIKNEKETVQNVLKFLKIDYVFEDFKAEVFNPYAEAKGSVSQFIMRNITIIKIADRCFSPETRRILREKLTKKQPKPKMNLEDREFLQKFYADDVRKLKSILGREFPWPNFFDGIE